MEHSEFVGSSVARQRYWALQLHRVGTVQWRQQTTGIAASPRSSASGHLGAIITQNVDGCTSAQAPVR